MKYLKTYESLKQDFDKEINDIEQKKIDLINNTKETVDEFMFSLTDEYDDSDNNWDHSPLGISIFKDKPFKILLKRSNWDGKEGDLSSWYHSVGTTGLSKKIDVESSFTITYYLKCQYSDGDYRVYDKRDKLDNFIDELESTTQRIKEVLGLEYRIMVRYAYDWKGDVGYHQHNHSDYSDITFLKAELAYRKEVDQYQQEKFGKPNGVGYTNVEILLELL